MNNGVVNYNCYTTHNEVGGASVLIQYVRLSVSHLLLCDSLCLLCSAYISRWNLSVLYGTNDRQHVKASRM